LKNRKKKWFYATSRRENKMNFLEELPIEFAVEAQKLLGVSLEGSVG